MYKVVLFSDVSRKLQGKGLGVYRLANHLRANGYPTKVIHGYIKLSDDEFAELADKFITDDTLLVGLGATVLANLEQSKFFGITNEQTRNRFELLRSKFPNVRLCLGGAQVTGATADFLQQFDYFDYFVKGQAEASALEIVKRLEANDPLPNGIISDKEYPFDDFNATTNFFESCDAIQHGEALPIEIARGCIFKCKFCGYDLIGKKLGDFVKRPELLREELIRNYNEYGTTDYYVADETINDSMEKVDMLLESVKDLPFKPKFGGFLRLDLIWKYPEMAQKLLDWGLETCSFGIETINDASGKSVGKGLGKQRIEETLTLLKEVWGDKVYVNASFILGLKYDDHNTAVELDAWIGQMFDQQKLHMVFVKPLYIMPGTGISYLDQHYQDQGYSVLQDFRTVKSDRIRTVVDNDCIQWKNDRYDYLEASKDADVIHEKYNNIKLCKGKIGKHNFAFVKSLLPDVYKHQLLRSAIHNVPFDGMTFRETEQYIESLEQQHFLKYIELLKK